MGHEYNSDRNHRVVVNYHSLEWDVLVTRGYITMEVNDGVAVMLHQRDEKYGTIGYSPNYHAG